MIVSNGQQLHVSMSKSKSLQHTWYDKNGTSLRLIAHSTQPMSNVSGVRQYELLINGKSFFNLPKVYEIGLKGSSAQDRRTPGVISDYEHQRGQDSATRTPLSYSGSGRNLVPPSSSSQVSFVHFSSYGKDTCTARSLMDFFLIHCSAPCCTDFRNKMN